MVKRGGWNVPLSQPIPDHLKCTLCSLLMRNPIQTIRGDLACESCYVDALENSPGICPIDNGPITKKEYFKDKFKNNEVGKIKCFCSSKEKGCSWEGTITEIENHLSTCLYQPSTCPVCNEVLHIDNSINNHLKECKEFGMSETTVCMYSNYGCKKQINSIEEHIAHIENDSLVHAMMQKKHFELMHSESMKLEKDLNSLKKSSEEALHRMNETVIILNEKVALLMNTVQETQNQLQNMNELSNVQGKFLGENEANSNKDGEVENPQITVAAIDTKLSKLDLKQQLFEKLLWKLDNLYFRNQQRMDKLDRRVTDIQVTNKQFQSEVNRISVRQRYLENCTCNGKILWKIDNLNFRMQQAVIGHVAALHSAPCFTEKYGYRFCGRLYLNGDGLGKSTHVSVFFVLMKSEYDNLLQWPFMRRVKFRLINQDDASTSIEESFIPDRFSLSFQKPVHDLNVATGYQTFISKDDLLSNGFVKDNAIFLEITVDNVVQKQPVEDNWH